MNKSLKIALNILVFVLIAGFGYYMVHSMTSGKTFFSGEGNAENTSVSPYKKTNSFTTASDIICFDIEEDLIYVVLSGKMSVLDLSGNRQRDFAIKTDARDIVVEDETIYLLYPQRIDLYTFDGTKKGEWAACSDNSDYCALTTSKDYVFVTDVADKLITQLDKEGRLVRFIKSPAGFIIPSYSFDIININDTIYCANSGRHKIESYTIDGEYITSFGIAGTQAGAFPGCCNPAFLAATPWGDIITSEKGIPRISCYGREGKFRTILLNDKILDGGTLAYNVAMRDDKIYVARKKSLSVFVFDPELAAQSACADCPIDCPLSK